MNIWIPPNYIQGETFARSSNIRTMNEISELNEYALEDNGNRSTGTIV